MSSKKKNKTKYKWKSYKEVLHIYVIMTDHAKIFKIVTKLSVWTKKNPDQILRALKLMLNDKIEWLIQ